MGVYTFLTSAVVSGDHLDSLTALPPGKSPWYRLGRSLVEPQGRNGSGGGQDSSCSCRDWVSGWDTTTKM
jgi:hypothetical protein